MTSPLMNGTSFSGPPSTASAVGSHPGSALLSPVAHPAGGGSLDGDTELMEHEALVSSPLSPSAVERKVTEKAKRLNPLQDLIQTEKAYVAELGSIIKKVARAWNRANFPPAELDTMFRNIEAIYRVNKSFLKALKDIGPEPTSPRALGNLLMCWIDDLNTPYCRYCENHFINFDTWPAVQSNDRLTQLLTEVSAPVDAAGEPKIFSDKKRQSGDAWTLDSLFALPQIRLRYYKKLYARLLKSTNPGRSDHRLLVGANDKLDELLEKAQRKISVGLLDESRVNGDIGTTGSEFHHGLIGESNRSSLSATSVRRSSPVAANGSFASRISQSPTRADPVSGLLDRISDLDIGRIGAIQGGKVSPTQSGKAGGNQVMSPISDLPLSPISPGTVVNPPPLLGPLPSQIPILAEDIILPKTQQELPAADSLERRLDMSRVVDLFTMKPKRCQLRINPPTLPFRRGMRKNSDVVINFTPSSTGEPISWRRGHIFLLTDLFLVCERMSHAGEHTRNADADCMWLLFPPLAGKHVQVADVVGSEFAMSVTILRKETLTLVVESREAKEEWMSAFAACNAFATEMGLKLKSGQTAPAQTKETASDFGLGVRGGTSNNLPASSPNGLVPQLSMSHSAASPPFRSATMDRAPPIRPGVLHPVNSIAPRDSLGSLSSGPFQPRSGGETVPDLTRSFAAGFGPESPDLRVKPWTGAPAPTMNHGALRPPPPQHGRLSFYPTAPVGDPMVRPPLRPGAVRPPFPTSAVGPAATAFGGLTGPHASGRHFVPPLAFISRPPPGPKPNAPLAGREPPRRPSAPHLRDRAHGAMTPPVRTRSASSMDSNGGGPKLPSERLKSGDLRIASAAASPPGSPQLKPKGPQTCTVSAQMRCRLYLKQSHAQWKSLGNARLKLFHLMPANDRQLVVENDRKMLISTIVLSDGVERVGKVGVAVEISDEGNRTGIVYMLQMRSEESAQGLFGELISGSGRTIAVT